MKDMLKLKDKLWDELAEIAKRPDIGQSDLELAHKLTDTIKNIDKICALEDGGGYSMARHWVRGHYSRDGRGGGGSSYGYDGGSSYGYDGGDYSRDGYSSRRGRGGRYSSDDGRESLMSHLSAAMATGSEEDREMIRKMLDQMRDR